MFIVCLVTVNDNMAFKDKNDSQQLAKPISLVNMLLVKCKFTDNWYFFFRKTFQPCFMVFFR